MNARTPAAASARNQAEKYLTFRLRDESCAVPVLKVCEIVQIREAITPVPQMPDYVRGVINLRGRLIPLIDLRARFQLGAVTDTVQICTIVVQACDSRIGVVVDGVEEVIAITADEISPPPNFGAAATPEYLLGMARTRGGIKCLLDLDRVISSETMVRLSVAA